MIRVEHLTKTFGRFRAVNDVSFAAEAGESVALWGGNGAGKTTIIRCVLGLLRFRGRIGVCGLDAWGQGKRARSLIGYVPQELGFYDDLRVADAVRFFARLKGVGRVSPESVLDQVGIGGHAGKRVRELSGGMKQRLALGIALLGDPPVLVLDEVTASLDACGREEFVGLLSRLSRGGRAMLFASHRTEEVRALATRVVTLDRGRLVSDAPVDRFGPETAPSATLHIHVDAPSREPAMRLLRGHGFEPRLNGVGLLVPVAAPRRAEPFRILERASIAVSDFEVLGGTGAGKEATP